jgi:hypothetical protein
VYICRAIYPKNGFFALRMHTIATRKAVTRPDIR